MDPEIEKGRTMSVYKCEECEKIKDKDESPPSNSPSPTAPEDALVCEECIFLLNK